MHGSRRILAFLLTSTSMIGLASGVSYNSIASSSQTIVHWSQPMQSPSLTQATASGPPLMLALSSALNEFSSMRILACSMVLLANRSGISVISFPLIPT